MNGHSESKRRYQGVVYYRDKLNRVGLEQKPAGEAQRNRIATKLSRTSKPQPIFPNRPKRRLTPAVLQKRISTTF